MKLIKAKRMNKNTYEAVYEKRCPCCGRKFKAAYPSDDYMLYVTAKDMVNSHYKTHLLCCADLAENCGNIA